MADPSKKQLHFEPRPHGSTPVVEAAIEGLLDSPMPAIDRATAHKAPIALSEVGRQGWYVGSTDVPLPLLTLDSDALLNNAVVMQRYADEHNAWLAPHGKTTMAPQIFAEQLRAGAWAITVATIPQLAVCEAFGVPRVVVATEVATSHDTRYLREQLVGERLTEVIVFVDSIDGVRMLDERLSGTPRRLPVLLEVGQDGGRTGVRYPATAVAIAREVEQSRHLVLAGVAGFEGTITRRQSQPATPDPVRDYLRELGVIANMLRPLARDVEPFLVSAGGSAYFDIVVAEYADFATDDMQLILRSGAYIAHDSGIYDKMSPLGSRRYRPSGDGLRAALTLWAPVISRPEERLAILLLGRRDAPYDAGLPVPLTVIRSDGSHGAVDSRYRIRRLDDHHAYLEVPSGSRVGVTDIVALGVSHPCSAFDRWRTLFTARPDGSITGAIRTYF